MNETVSDSRVRWALRALIGGSALLLSLSLFVDLRGGWSNWKQGDWLINSLEGPIRRGPIGSLLIHIADAFNVSPITVVVATQALLGILLYVAFYRIVVGLADPRLGLLLSISPAMFLILWVSGTPNVPHALANSGTGALRKEVIGMVAVLLMVLYLRKRQTWMPVLAAVLLAGGAWAHEIVVLFIPLFCYLAWVAARSGQRVLIGALTAVVVVSGVAAAIYALTYTRVDTVAQVCDPLLARDVADRVCKGAIDWVTADQERAAKSLRYRDLNPRGLRDFAIMLAISLPALGYAAWLLQKRRVALLGLLATVPYLPLYAIVSDWGRWMSCGVFAFVTVLLAHAVTDDLRLRRRPAVPVLLGLGVLGLLVVPYHINGVVYGGVITHIPTLVADFVGSLS